MAKKTTFKDRLKDLMADSNLSVKDLSEKINVNKATIYRWLKEPVQVTLTCLLSLADLFECTIEYLVGRSGDARKVKPVQVTPFGIRVRVVMKERGISTYALARDTKYDGKYLQQWKEGNVPLLPTLIELSGLFDCTIDYLVGRE